MMIVNFQIQEVHILHALHSALLKHVAMRAVGQYKQQKL